MRSFLSLMTIKINSVLLMVKRF